MRVIQECSKAGVCVHAVDVPSSRSLTGNAPGPIYLLRHTGCVEDKVAAIGAACIVYIRVAVTEYTAHIQKQRNDQSVQSRHTSKHQDQNETHKVLREGWKQER